MKVIIPKNRRQGKVSRLDGTVFKYAGWPTVTKDDRGVLYCVASAMRVQHVDPAGKNCMFLSFNEGETWTCPIIVNDTYLDDRDAGIAYLGDGKFVMSFFNQRDYEDCARFVDYEWLRAPEKQAIIGMGKVCPHLEKDGLLEEGNYVKLSNDYGVTWSENIPVPMTAPHGPNVSKDGSVIFMGRISTDENPENVSRIGFYRSEDDGRTWDLKGIVPMPDDVALTTDHLHEPHVVELPNGRLIGAIRCHCRPVEPEFTVYTTFSDDGGYTWSKPRCIGVDGSPPHLMVHSSGAVICSYSCRNGDKRSERAAVSYDGGETWAEDYELNADVPWNDLGYPATVELADGSLLTVYYQVWPGDYWCSVLQTKWSLEK